MPNTTTTSAISQALLKPYICPYVLPMPIIPSPIGVLSASAVLTGITSAGRTPSTVARVLSAVVFIRAVPLNAAESRPAQVLRSDQRDSGIGVAAISGIYVYTKPCLVRSLPHIEATPIAQAESSDGSRYDVLVTVSWLGPWIAADRRAEVPSL